MPGVSSLLAFCNLPLKVLKRRYNSCPLSASLQTAGHWEQRKQPLTFSYCIPRALSGVSIEGAAVGEILREEKNIKKLHSGEGRQILLH